MEANKDKHLHEKSTSFSSEDQNDNTTIKNDNPNDDKEENQSEKYESHNSPHPKTSAASEIVEEVKRVDGDEALEKKDGEENQPTEIIEEVPDLGKVSEEIDQFISTLALAPPKSGNTDDEGQSDQPPKMPDSVEKFAFLVEAKVSNYDSVDTHVKWIELPEDDSIYFLEMVDRVSKLSTSLSKFSSDPDYASSINRIGGILQRALSFLEEEFKLILEDYSFIDHDHGSKANQHDSSSTHPTELDQTMTEPDQGVTESNSEPEVLESNFPGYSDDIVSNLNKLVNALLSAGHEMECCQVYLIMRRKALDVSLHRLGFEKSSIDDVQKKQWEPLERDIVTWNKTFKEFSTIILSSERKLTNSVFSRYDLVSQNLFRLISRGVMIQLLNFAEAVVMTKRSSEKLFKFLDVYETLRDLPGTMDGLFTTNHDFMDEIKSEASMTRCRLGETMVCIFCELENSIRADIGKTPVPGGAVHPLTRYTMNYLKYACEYKDTLEQVFKEHQKIDRADSSSRSDFTVSSTSRSYDNEAPKRSPFELQLSKLMDLLDKNLEAKSKVYRDTSLSLIFLMNNGRYMLQKIKGSAEVHSLLADSWCRKRSSDLRSYHKNYQRETWGRLLQCLSPDGLNVHGKVVKPVLKEKFKSFNAMFDEIHKTQSTWIVSDEQLQSELRVSISAVVIPAYRSFMARFSSIFTPGRQTEKYIKFQPEDIETCIDELFDGSSAGSFLGRRR